MTSTIVKLGNSNDIVIPAKVMKILNLSERDSLELILCNGGLLLRRSSGPKVVTAFSPLDEWVEENCTEGAFSLDESLKYVESLRGDRVNKVETK